MLTIRVEPSDDPHKKKNMIHFEKTNQTQAGAAGP
jgi:hypothetical protein